MKYAVNVALSALLLVGTTALGDDSPKTEPPPDPCVTDLTLDKLDNPPERKTKFELVEEKWKERLVDVKAADQKFAAVIQIQLPRSSGNPYDPISQKGFGRYTLSGVPEWIALQHFGYTYLLYPNAGDDRVSGDEKARTVTRSIARILEQVPRERRPPKEQLEWLTSSAERLVILGPYRRLDQRLIVILATSSDQAKERSKDLLFLFDHGFSRSLQVALYNERIKRCGILGSNRENLAAAHKRLEALTARLKEFEGFTPDLLSGLRVQQLQLEVDMAGIKARIAACEKLLARTANERKKEGIADRISQIEDAKISAEIELSGCEARQAKSAEFVKKVMERSELEVMKSVAADSAGKLQKQCDFEAGQIRAIDYDIAAFAPVRLVDDRVTIHPLEWTQ